MGLLILFICHTYNERSLQPHLSYALIVHLVGSKHNDKRWKRSVIHIQRETNCFITVNLLHRRVLAPPITITVEARSHTALNLRLDEAREKIIQLLLDYLDFIRDENAKSLLIYDVASSCRGNHRPAESTSCAVRVKDPSGLDCFVSILDLPVEYAEGVRPNVLGKVKNLTNCTVRVCGNHFKVPLVNCKPHVIVSGLRWQDVDRAVEILKDEARRHASNCSCRF